MTSSAFMYFIALYNMSIMIFRSIFVDREKEFPLLESIGEGRDQNLVVGFINQQSFLIELSHIFKVEFIQSLFGFILC